MTKALPYLLRSLLLCSSLFGCIGQVDGTYAGAGVGGQAPTGQGGDPGQPGSGGNPGQGSGTGGARGTGGAGMSDGGSAAGLPCDVQSVLSMRCGSCHGVVPAQGAPMSLVSYADLTAPSLSNPSMTRAVLSVARMQSASLPMPPAPATPASATETATIQTWINAGYPAGTCGASPDGGAGGDGGVVSDPFKAPATCTSNRMWTSGNQGSASMNPGMACIACHSTGEGPAFSIAGTVYPTAHEPDRCNGFSGSAQIVIVGADGRTTTLTPNTAGNFYSTATIAKPFQAKVVYQGRERVMVAAQTSGDCNSCHTQPGAMSAPGRILLP